MTREELFEKISAVEATQDIIARSVHGDLSDAEEQRVIADAG